jgi:hypothetical protein
MSQRILEITTVKNCVVECTPICPQVKFREEYGDKANILSLENFKLALSHTPKDVAIHFAGFSEPFINSRGIDMLEFAKNEGYTVNLASTLVGLQAKDVPRLKGLGFFDLHLPDANGIAHIAPTPNYLSTLYQTFSTVEVTRYVKFDGSFQSNDRAGNCDDAKPLHVKGPFLCPKLSYAPGPVMLPNGDCVLCCMDWKLEHPLGNLFTQTYDELLQSEVYRMVQANRWKMDGDTLCRSCKYAWSIPKTVAVGAAARVNDWGRRRLGF